LQEEEKRFMQLQEELGNCVLQQMKKEMCWMKKEKLLSRFVMSSSRYSVASLMLRKKVAVADSSVNNLQRLIGR
jgi:hypothetical protein